MLQELRVSKFALNNSAKSEQLAGFDTALRLLRRVLREGSSDLRLPGRPA